MSKREYWGIKEICGSDNCRYILEYDPILLPKCQHPKGNKICEYKSCPIKIDKPWYIVTGKQIGRAHV